MQTIDANQLQDMKDEGKDFLLINTLPSDAFEHTRIEGAVNIPQSQPDFAEVVSTVSGEKQKPIVVYCANDSCDSSVEAARKLEDAGFPNVYEFSGGAKEWKLHAQEQS
jgi:rhodanese-related sulfurtransferase